MHWLQVIFIGFTFLLCENANLSSANLYYGIKPFQGYENPLYGSIFSYNPTLSEFSFFANFSYHSDDNTSDPYYFVSGPVATSNSSSSSLMYMCIQCGVSAQLLFLFLFDMTKKIYKQSEWISHNGHMAYLFHDPQRQRLVGLRDVEKSSLIMEEYDMKTLDVVQKYTQQDDGKYAFPEGRCSIFDYEENWIVEVRTRYETPLVYAYFVKMDLNLVGKKDDIVTEFYLMPDVGAFRTMTYDMKKKLVLATWQHGYNYQDLFIVYMNPYTSKLMNEKLLLKTPNQMVVEHIQAIYDESTRQVSFMIHHRHSATLDDQYWIIIVEFDTMKMVDKKQITTIPDFETWEYFTL